MKTFKYNDITISFDETELYKIVEKHLTKNRTETGGIITGSYIDNFQTAKVINFYEPPKDSKFSRTTFERGIYGLNKVLENEWKEGRYYLGDWHLHPYSAPIASCQDSNQLAFNSRDQDLRCPEPIMIIVGGKDNKEVSVYLYIENDIRLCKELKLNE